MRTTLLLAFFALACDNSQAQINITKTVGSEGGTVSGSDGTTLDVPMGALAMSTSITISPVTVTLPTGLVQVGPAYDFEPEGTSFAQAVTITLPFDTAKIPSGLTSADVLIYSAPKGMTNFQMDFTTLDGNTVKTSTTHFTTYVPATPAGPCMPACTGGPDACTCNATCNGATEMLGCSSSTSGGMLFCYCELNHQTMSAPQITSCDQAMSAFSSCFAG